MKGFIKILEAVIASIIILTSLAFFFNIAIRPTNWDDTLTQLRAESILASLVKNGTLQDAVKNNDAEKVNRLLTDNRLSMIPPTFDYSLRISGVPNPKIFIGCDCTDDEIDTLKVRLGPLDFTYKGRGISILVDKELISSIRNETNILFLPRYMNLNSNKQKLDNFLERGGTIFMMSDLTEPQVNDGYMDATFGLKWKSGSRSNNGKIAGAADANRTSFKIAKYIKDISDFDETTIFTFSGAAAIETDNRTVVSDNGFSLVKINGGIVNGNGRTVWSSESPNADFNNNLTKSVIMWASGESFKLDVIKKTPQSRIVRSRVIVFDNDVYEAILTIWKVLK